MSDQEITMGVMVCMAQWKEDPPGEDEPIEEVAKRAFRMSRDNNYV